MGLGYVGLPIAIEFAKKGYRVNGLDNNLGRIRKLKKGGSYINDVPDKEIKKLIKKGNFQVTSNDKVLGNSDAVIVCVPTPLRKIKDPDISYIILASRTIRKYLHPGQFIVVESTTYPGTSREVILPELEKSGYSHGKDFLLAFSPERIDPGNPEYNLVNIPKVIGGLDREGTELGKFLYSKILKKVVGVPNAEIAEVTKLLENTFRIVNIALINEFSMLCDKLNIDVWEVLRAAGTKPFGFMPFYPGPGIGGHCIPADPMYLSWKARKVGFETKMIDLAAETNRFMPLYVVQRIKEILGEKGKKIKGSKILISGVAYKKDVNDLRESPALDIIKQLRKKGAKLKYHDTYIPYLDIHGLKYKSCGLTASLLKNHDIVVIVTDHSDVDYSLIRDNAPVIFDTRNVYSVKDMEKGDIIKL
jgi:UDP-N-acetyl-D-glucosamine dehydrogenase